MDRLKTPQQTAKPAPTSVGQSGTDKDKVPAVAKEPVTMDAEIGDLDFDPWKESTIQPHELFELFKQHDTLTGDWAFDRALDTASSPATTPDTNVSKDTTSTQETDISETDNLNITLGMESMLGSGNKAVWEEIDDHWASTMAPSLAEQLGDLGVDEGLMFRVDENTDLTDWDSMFGPGSTFDGNKVPGWAGEGDEVPLF